jgi:hypothetical protein
MKIIISIIFMFVSCGNVSAKEEIWECYWREKAYATYKIDTEKISIASRDRGKWVYLKDIVYDKTNQNMSNSDGNNIWDLILKTQIVGDNPSPNQCKVIDP